MIKSVPSLITDRIAPWSTYVLFAVLPVFFLWGCTMAPSKKLVVEGLAESFGEDTIISTRLGKPVGFDEMIADLHSCRITYVGEKHTDTAQHRHQLEIIQSLFKENRNLAVGMEMFDVTYQGVLDQWSAGELDEQAFLRKTQWYANWGFSFSLYREILDFIKENHIRLVALNIPGYIPDRIREGGIENLTAEDKKYLPDEIDTSNSAHREFLLEVFNHHHHIQGRVDFEDFYMAQLVWEESMAEAIARNLKESDMVVLAGNGHIQFKYGIPDRAFRRTGATFRTVYQAPAGIEVNRDIADYIWVTP